MCTETVLLSLSETYCQFRLLQRERWPTPWIFLDLVNNQCPILIGSFTLLRSYLTNSVTVYECEPISIQSYFHAIKTRKFSHSLVDSNKHSWKWEKELGGQQLLSVCETCWESPTIQTIMQKRIQQYWKVRGDVPIIGIFQKDKDLFLTFFMRYI